MTRVTARNLEENVRRCLREGSALAHRFRFPVRSVTNRTGIGLLVVALVLLAVIIVPNAMGRTVPGVAPTTQVSGAPTVGDCVGQKFDLDWSVRGDDPSKYRYPELALGNCGLAHYG